jgi:thiamine-phosphate pyrophosphorylase
MNDEPRRLAPRLIVVTDTSVADEAVLVHRVDACAALAAPGSVMVQLRDKTLPIRRRRALGERLVAVCRARAQGFVVNDRLDLAVLLGADGVHLGEDAVATEDARAVLPPGAWVSRAVHTVDDAGRCTADAVLLSPIASPRKGRPALGLSALTEARAAISRQTDAAPRLYALGGIDASNAAQCLSSGADGVAVVGAVLDGRDPAPLLDALGIRR